MKAHRLNPGSKERLAPWVNVNNSVNQPPPRPPSAGALPHSTAGGRVLEGTQPAPLLVLARFGTTTQLTKNNSRRVTPLLAQRYPLPGNSYFWRTAADEP